jgi:hypothetical protein
MKVKETRSGCGVGGSVPPIAQEPPAMRAQVTEAPGKAQLRNMIGALEQMLVNMPESLEHLPHDLNELIKGAYVQDWRNLAASSRHGAEMVRSSAHSFVFSLVHSTHKRSCSSLQ